jgi:RNA polymerase sigma factor (sigma-70 family)
MAEQSLYELLLQQDSSAFDFLYSRFFPTVRLFVKDNSGSEDDAQDIFQDGIIALWDQMVNGKYTHQSDLKLGNYLLMICKYRWLERVKSYGFRNKKAMGPDFSIENDDISQLQSMIDSEEVQQLNDSFHQLNQKCQEILTLFFYERKSFAEIADILGYTENSTKNEKYRCMIKLKELYKK